MATYRTPSAIFHSQVEFLSNGELATDSVLNRPSFQLDDKAQFLKEAQDLNISKSNALASAVGEPFDGTDTPLWNSPVNFLQGDSHHSAIEKLDAAILNIGSSGNTGRLDVLDNQKLGEDSTSNTPPDWSQTRTPFFVQLGDTHHQAIDRLDAAASTLRLDTDANTTAVSALNSKVFSTLTPNLATAEANIGALQVVTQNMSVIQQTQAASITSNSSQIVLEKTKLSSVSQALITNEALASLLACKMTTVESQINVLRAFHTPPLSGPIINFCP